MGASNVHPWKHIVSHGDRNAVYDMRERTILVTSSLCALPIDNPQMRPIPTGRHGDAISLRLLTTHIRIDSDADLAIKLVSDAYKRWYCLNHAIIVDENAEQCALEVIETLGKLGCAASRGSLWLSQNSSALTTHRTQARKASRATRASISAPAHG